MLMSEAFRVWINCDLDGTDRKPYVHGIRKIQKYTHHKAHTIVKLKLARIFAPTQKIVWRDKLIKFQKLWNCGKTRVIWKCEGGITQSETEPLQNWSTLVEILLFCLPKFWAWTAGKFRKCTLFPLKYNQFVLENDHATFFRGTMQDPQHCFGRQTLSKKLFGSYWK